MAERNLILLTGDGHLEIVWEDHEDEYMREMIAKKMKEGVRFYIRKPVSGTPLTTMKQVKRVTGVKENHISVHDEDIRKLFSEGKIGLGRAPDGALNEETVLTTDPREVVRKPSIGVQPLQGG
jgi:hypothetical protein